MSWIKGTVVQISTTVSTSRRTEKGTFGQVTATTVKEEMTYTFLVQCDDGRLRPLADTASRAPLLPLMKEGDRVEFSRCRGTSEHGFAQLSIDFAARNPIPRPASVPSREKLTGCES